MARSTFQSAAHPNHKPSIPARRYLLHLIAICFLCAVIWVEFGRTTHAIAFEHTNPSVDTGCQQLTFSQDGNPFPLCPGPYPGGGNCVWWAWEQWHLLGYNLPLNWGNAAEWIVDAERFGLPLGTLPRLGSIAVFPVADGVWAFGTAGHVAFVTAVSQDRSTFNVTYQNYGDPTPMFVGTGYNVSYINQPRFQNGQMRFIYFPGTIDATRFSHLPGVDGNAVAQVAQVAQANKQMQSDSTSGASSRVALGLPPGAYDQEFSADFTGTGLTDLLLYNRQQGSLDVLTFAHRFQQIPPHIARYSNQNQPPVSTPNALTRISLGDTLTPANGWGSSLDIVIGDFRGSGHADILLYDRVSGSIQLLSLTPQLTIQKHVVLPGWGPGWELYAGQFDGVKSDLFLYNRLLVPNPAFVTPTPTGTQPPSSNPTSNPTSTATGTPATSPSPTATPSSSPTTTPTSTITPGPSPTVTPTPSPTVTPSPSPTTTPTSVPSPTTTPTVSPSPTPSPTITPTSTPSPGPSPTPSLTPSPTTLPSPTVTPTPSPSTTGTSAGNGHLALPFTASDTPQKPVPGGDLSGNTLVAPQNPPLPPPNVLLLSFTSDLHIQQQQAYTLMSDSWEVYIGRFVNAHQDGLFLYDRTAGEARILDFSSALLVNHYQPLHNLVGNWDIHTGDFAASGRAQVLLYDPGTGDLRFLVFAPDLSPTNQVDDPGLNTGQVLYVGHFGLPALSVMLYDPAAGQSTFVAFDSSLQVAQQIAVPTWDHHWQILIGAFLDRSLCSSASHCATLDDVLVLNRQSGHIQQYSFTFGNQYKVFDNRLQAFLRAGVVITARLQTIDTSSLTWQASLDASITTEELY